MAVVLSLAATSAFDVTGHLTEVKLMGGGREGARRALLGRNEDRSQPYVERADWSKRRDQNEPRDGESEKGEKVRTKIKKQNERKAEDQPKREDKIKKKKKKKAEDKWKREDKIKN